PDALSVGGRALSREELLGAAGAVAARIAGAPVVAVRATATPETVVAVVGALLAGVPVVPVPPDSGPAERDHILRDSGATLLLTGEPVDAPVETVPVDLTERAAWTKPEPDPESTAFILYTSGTTGAPKGALISRRAVAADLDGLAAAWTWTAE